jgi:hypothetical protein
MNLDFDVIVASHRMTHEVSPLAQIVVGSILIFTGVLILASKAHLTFSMLDDQPPGFARSFLTYFVPGFLLAAGALALLAGLTR